MPKTSISMRIIGHSIVISLEKGVSTFYLEKR